MSVFQHETSFSVIKLRIRPANCGVAVAALHAVATLVIVFAQVARSTAVGKIVLEILAGMAVLTAQPAVTVLQRESGFQRMVEADALPGFGAVTILAGRTVVSLVYVIYRMAGIASRWRTVEYVATMTIDAQHRRVPTGERVVRVVVIEYGFGPVGFGVAVLTMRSERRFVDVVWFVTANAIRRRIAVLVIGIVAVATRNAAMRTAQRKIRERVIKQASLKLHDVRISAFMVGVTGNAFVARRGFKLSVKASEVCSIFTDILMACDTEICAGLV